MSGMGMTSASCLNSEQFRNGVRGTWFKPNCPVLSPYNEASEVIKMVSVLFQILIRRRH